VLIPHKQIKNLLPWWIPNGANEAKVARIVGGTCINGVSSWLKMLQTGPNAASWKH